MNDGFESIKKRIDLAVANGEPIVSPSAEGYEEEPKLTVAEQMRADAYGVAKYLIGEGVEPINETILGILVVNKFTPRGHNVTTKAKVQAGSTSYVSGKYGESVSHVPNFVTEYTTKFVRTGGINKTGMAIMITGELCMFRDKDTSTNPVIKDPVKKEAIWDLYLDPPNSVTSYLWNYDKNPRIVMWRELLAEFGSHALLGKPFTPRKFF